MPRGPSGPGAAAEVFASLQQRVRAAVERAAQGRPTLPELADRLREGGIEVRPNLASTGRLSGLSFEVEGVRLKGSELGREFSWRALSARYGIGFEPERDRSRFTGPDGATGRSMAAEAAEAGDVAERPPARTPQTPLYRAAAVLSSRIEVLDQVEALGRGIAEQAETSRRAQEVLVARLREQQAVAVTPAALSAGLTAAYDSPQAAGARLDALVAGQGAQHTAQVLEQSPEALGKLRGVEFGGLRSATRREALAATGRLAGELRAAAGREARLVESAPVAAAAAARRETAAAQLHRLATALGRLPHRFDLEKEMVRAVGVLGERLTMRLAPAALARTLLGRALRVARDLVRGMDDRSLGR
jgi:hypothetical protein